MLLTTEICCDLSCRGVPPHIYAKQNDKNSRQVKVSFADCGESVDLSSVSRSEIRVQKPDGTLTVSSGESPSSGTITFPLSQESLTVAGLAMVDFLLYGSDDSIISAVPAAMTIAAAAVKSTSSSGTGTGTGSGTDTSSIWSAINSLSASITQTLERLGGLSFKKLTETEYKALTPDANTIYFITDSDGNIIKHNAGSVSLGNGTVDVVAVATVIEGTTVTAKEVKEETETDSTG